MNPRQIQGVRAAIAFKEVLEGNNPFADCLKLFEVVGALATSRAEIPPCKADLTRAIKVLQADEVIGKKDQEKVRRLIELLNEIKEL